MRSWLKALGSFILAALLSSPVWGASPPEVGTLNYVEGQAEINGQPVTGKSVGSAVLGADQSLDTEKGRAEILLTPGIFLRLDDNSSVKMVDSGLADTVVALQHGRAMVEVTEIRRENNVRLNEDNVSTRL